VSFLEDEASTRVIVFYVLEELRLKSQKNAAVNQRVTNTILQLLTNLKNILESQACAQEDLEEKNGTDQQTVAIISDLRKRDKKGNWTEDLPMVKRLCQLYTLLHGKVIRDAILSSNIEYVHTKPKEINRWVSIQMSARVDVAGGWSDTPPLCYTNPLGGLVVNIAVRVNGIRPIEIRARRMPKKAIHLRSGDVQVRCTTLEDFNDYNDPKAALSLFKCVLICMGIIKLGGAQVQPLSKQLEDGGFEVQVFSSLPHGSGLGSSSILAAGVARALADLVGRRYSVQSLVHLVLAVEQTLTTGGGYQDQVGGLMGGIKSCATGYGLPVKVTSIKLDGSKIIPLLNKRMLLIFTGKRRIAKGILQSVVNRWSRRSPEVCNLLKGIVENASEMCKAVEEGNLERFGKCLKCYDQQKNQISDGGWTLVDIIVREKLAPYAAGIGICGAGGGGFMLFVAKNPIDENLLDDIRWKLQNEIRTHGVSLWKCTVDPDGMKTADMAIVEESYRRSSFS
jgi:fucokinase